MEANTFELADTNVRITYAAQGNAGQPVLTYEGPEGNNTFQAADIRTTAADVAVFVTVTLRKAIDRGTEMLTLLVPTVIVAGEVSVAVRTEAVFTSFPNVVGRKTLGQVQMYRVEALAGLARFFPVDPPSAQARANTVIAPARTT